MKLVTVECGHKWFPKKKVQWTQLALLSENQFKAVLIITSKLRNSIFKKKFKSSLIGSKLTTINSTKNKLEKKESKLWPREFILPTSPLAHFTACTTIINLLS